MLQLVILKHYYINVYCN